MRLQPVFKGRAMREALPALLAEIADATDLGTALAVAEAAGGQEVFIVARPNAENWLVKAVGTEKAIAIADALLGGGKRMKFTIPFGPAGSYLRARRQRARAMAEAVDAGKSANEIARAAGVTNRSARRFRAALRDDPRQGKLFD